jgi:glycosyltransferase involved in cell wall biosynthesis
MPMKTAKIGVVIPAYNASRFISECIESALFQKDANVRIYVSDDASTDKTPAIVESISRKHPGKIALVARSENRGEGYTRQEATEMAIQDACEYIVPLDADDIRKPNTILPQVALLERSGAKVGVCYSDTDFIHTNGFPVNKTTWETVISCLKGRPQGIVWSQILSRGKIGTMDTMVFRSKAIENVRYDPELKFFADVDYLAQIATNESLNEFVYMKGIVASYRFHAGQALNRIESNRYGKLYYDTMKTISNRTFRRLDRQNRRPGKMKRAYLWRLVALRALVNAIRYGSFDGFLEYLFDIALPIKRLDEIGDRQC